MTAALSTDMWVRYLYFPLSCVCGSTLAWPSLVWSRVLVGGQEEEGSWSRLLMYWGQEGEAGRAGERRTPALLRRQDRRQVARWNLFGGFVGISLGWIARGLLEYIDISRRILHCSL